MVGHNHSLHFIFIPTKFILLIGVMSPPGGIDQKCCYKNNIKKLMVKVQLNIFSNTELTFLMTSDSVCHKMHFSGGGNFGIQDGRHKRKLLAWHPP